MTRKMLIDAAQNEEIRVAVVDGKKVEDFDFESSTRKPLRGNIYLARVTRVEPSLQAAFVEYGGNRHGFLAFSEIHPDYYQIPVSDREILQAAEQKMTKLAEDLEIFQNGEDEEEDEEDENIEDKNDFGENDLGDDDHDNITIETKDSAETDSEDNIDEHNHAQEPTSDDKGSLELDGDLAEIIHKNNDPEDSDHEDNDSEDSDKNDSALLKSDDLPSMSEPLTGEPPIGDQDDEEANQDNINGEGNPDSENNIGDDENSDDFVASEGSVEAKENSQQSQINTKKAKRKSQYADLLENYHEARRNHARILRNYKIQEVVKARQILLVQVVKEERGNKGAALTSYMSLAGRYCVLMPNTARGGGISRKIPSAADRKRLRRVVNELDVTQGMGLIIRTAGAKRTKSEIKRDYDYLLRLWETIRNLTMDSVAPSLIYEEASLIKRAIRDLYDKDTSRIIVEGEEGYREAKDFMKMLMPSHAKNVQAYRDASPLFMRFDVEQQLDSMYQPSVRLKSGGYLVIHQTEALIAVDVNSGKATRERNIEATALKTNLEAAQEVARQCKLRDLAGLIVIDFIDMEDMKNNRAVEKRLKESMKGDRARIQIGRISSFGLMEMSRQRRRSGIIDGTTNACPTCNGSGAVRSNEMAALRILRAIENEAVTSHSAIIAARTSYDVALYILNHKREWLSRIETQHALNIEIAADPMKAGDQYEIEKRGPARVIPPRNQAVQADLDSVADKSTDDENGDDERQTSHTNTSNNDGDEQGSGRKRRRRRRKRKGPYDDENPQNIESQNIEANETAENTQPSDANANNQDMSNVDESDSKNNAVSNDTAIDENDDGKPKKRRRRGRRGGRRNQENTQDAPDTQQSDTQQSDTQQEEQPAPDASDNSKPDNDDLASKSSSIETGPTETSPTEKTTDEADDAKPKRKRTSSRKSTKKVKESTQQGDDDNAQLEAAEEKTTARKTTKKRASRKRTTKAADSDKAGSDKKADIVSSDDDAVSTNEANDKSEDKIASKPERKPRAKKATSRKSAPKKAASIEKAESVNVKPTETGNMPDAPEAKPKKERKGWWQRALGGE